MQSWEEEQGPRQEDPVRRGEDSRGGSRGGEPGKEARKGKLRPHRGASRIGTAKKPLEAAVRSHQSPQGER